MNKVFKFNTKDQKIWISSDFHLNHSPKWDVPICKMRGFDSVGEMNEYIINITNFSVGPNDILIHLGDLTLNTDRVQFDHFISQLKCQRIIVLFGNHPNPMLKIYREEVKKQFGLDPYKHEVYPLQYKNIEFWGDYAEVVIDGVNVVLSHFPILSWNHMGHGSWMLHGHCHGKLHDINWIEENLYKEGKILDVSFDFYKRVLSFQEIFDKMSCIPILKIDHH